MVDNIPDPEIWDLYIDASDAWAVHSETCEICTDQASEDDVWRIDTTECTKGRLIIATIKECEIVLGLTPTNR
jgi:hypothetical protein